MSNGELNWISNFIWGIADDVLHHVYDRTKYRDIILPMTVIRRLDAVLEPTRAAVLARKAELDAAGIPEAAQGPALDRAAGQAFHNRSPFTLRQLLARPNPETQKADFEAYLDGFVDTTHSFIIHAAETLDQPDTVHGSYLAKDSYGRNQQTRALASGQQDMNRAEWKAHRRRDWRHGGHFRQPVRNVVLDDKSRPRFLDFPAYRWVERREVDFTALRVAVFSRFCVSSRCHAPSSTANQSAAISRSKS